MNDVTTEVAAVSTVESTAGRTLAPLDLVLAWTAGLIGYLVAEYGAGAAVASAIGDGGADALPSWVWLPWIAGPVLCGLLAGGVLPPDALPLWWHQALAGAGVPALAAPVTMLVVGEAGPAVLTGVLVQVVVAALVALGAARARRWVQPHLPSRAARAPEPARYT